MTETDRATASILIPPFNGLLESNLDIAPLELTVTTSISSLTPSSDVSAALSSRSSTPAALHELEDHSTAGDETVMDVRSNYSVKDEDYGNLLQHRQQKSRVVHMKSESIGLSDNEIKPGARFLRFSDFERVFEHWKTTSYHPFRVASSETLRNSDGSTNTVFKYRYIVYHCAHYGLPRMRGVGKRPNQNYMPCGCKAMLRLNFSWAENILRVTTLNEHHHGHDVTEDAYLKFTTKTKQRQSSMSPPIVSGAQSVQQSGASVQTKKRRRSESPNVVKTELGACSNQIFQQQHPAKIMKNGYQQSQSEGPLNLSKDGVSDSQQVQMKRSASANCALPGPHQSIPLLTQTPALSVLMFNQQQQTQRQQAYHELVRLLSVGVNGTGPGLVTALGANGVRDCRTESERHRLIYPVLQTLSQHLASARGYDFDEKLRDLKAVLKKWQFIPTPTVPAVSSVATFVPRTTSAAAAAAAMMVQAMSAGAGAQFANGNGAGLISGNDQIYNGR